jgi:glycosyltransferase involved in cell wall biosynthesis
MDGWAKEIREEGVVVHRQSLKGLGQRSLRFIQALSDRAQIELVSEFCRRIQPSAILVNQQYDEDGLDYLMGALRSGVTSVGGVMHMPMTRTKNRRPFGWLRGRVLAEWYRRHPYRLILVSEGAQTEFESYYAHPRPTAVVNNAIPLEVADCGKSQRTVFPENSFVIGFVGQFVPQKNLAAVIGAWLSVRQSRSDCRLLLIGDGPDRPAVEEILRRNAPIDSWHITGWRTDADQFLSEMDVFVLASHFEGLPLSLVEAAARGIPSVVAPFNGASDVARHAPWVRVAKSSRAEDIGAVLSKVLVEMRHSPLPTGAELEHFRSVFSLRRMASEILRALGLDAECT